METFPAGPRSAQRTPRGLYSELFFRNSAACRSTRGVYAQNCSLVLAYYSQSVLWKQVRGVSGFVLKIEIRVLAEGTFTREVCTQNSIRCLVFSFRCSAGGSVECCIGCQRSYSELPPGDVIRCATFILTIESRFVFRNVGSACWRPN